MAEREVKKWITINGKHIPLYEDAGSSDMIPQAQKEFEESIRNSKTEHIGFFDKDGNKLFETSGTEEDVTFGDKYEDDEDWEKTLQFNREVEQRVWNDEEVHDVHNHPENTIFSPEDMEAFEALENKSMSIVLPNGTTYRMIREQPRTSNVIIIDTETGESHREFEAKKIAEAYYDAYSKIWDPGWEKIKAETGRWTPERAKAEAELDKKVLQGMEKWLKKNAKDYGYRFEAIK